MKASTQVQSGTSCLAFFLGESEVLDSRYWHSCNRNSNPVLLSGSISTGPVQSLPLSPTAKRFTHPQSEGEGTMPTVLKFLPGAEYLILARLSGPTSATDSLPPPAPEPGASPPELALLLFSSRKHVATMVDDGLSSPLDGTLAIATDDRVEGGRVRRRDGGAPKRNPLCLLSLSMVMRLLTPTG